jgi:hypothetical protein
MIRSDPICRKAVDDVLGAERVFVKKRPRIIKKNKERQRGTNRIHLTYKPTGRTVRAPVGKILRGGTRWSVQLGVRYLVASRARLVHSRLTGKQGSYTHPPSNSSSFPQPLVLYLRMTPGALWRKVRLLPLPRCVCYERCAMSRPMEERSRGYRATRLQGRQLHPKNDRGAATVRPNRSWCVIATKAEPS